jgi:O-antigen/teichoic acid export membrane protein
MSGKQRLEVVNTITMVGLNFLLNLLLIPRFGIHGAAVATGISIASVNLLKLLQVYFLFGLQPYTSRYFRGIIAIGVASVFGYASRAVLIYVGISTYGMLGIAGVVFLVSALVGFWWFGLEEEEKLAVFAWRTR